MLWLQVRGTAHAIEGTNIIPFGAAPFAANRELFRTGADGVTVKFFGFAGGSSGMVAADFAGTIAALAGEAVAGRV